MRARWLREALDVADLRLGSDFPRDLAAAIPVQLPVSIVELQRLSTGSVQSWLHDRGVPHDLQGNRRLHGGLVAHAGAAIVFLDARDDQDERRFTLAHETAHVIHDHLVPRARALRALGDSIRPVLDGERKPSREEELSAVLAHVPLGVQVHLMARTQRGSIFTWEVEESERRADRLALELIAPHAVFSRELGLHGPRALSERFGLPPEVAESYADLVQRRTRRRPRLSETLARDSR